MNPEPEAAAPPLIEWGVASRPFPGESESGDCHLVKPFPGGVLIAVVDGLGHGPEAAHSASLAISTLEAHAAKTVSSLVSLCHDRLRGSRGVAITLASLSSRDSTMTWLGVANVEGVLLRADSRATSPREYVVQRGGVVGAQLPPLRPSMVALSPGDTLILATDGIRSGFLERLRVSDAPQRVADHILATRGKSTDDALVLVARYVGGVA
jgi:hypothetical protein